MEPLIKKNAGITAGVRTTYLDWCTDAAPEDAYVPSQDYAVEVDLKKRIAYTREAGRPLLKDELEPPRTIHPEWVEPWAKKRCKRCEHWWYEHSSLTSDGDSDCGVEECRCWGFKEY